MSRIGRQPIALPAGVTLSQNGGLIEVTGPKGTLTQQLMPGIALAQEGDQLIITKTVEDVATQSSFGLMRTLVANMVIGVSTGFERTLEINGVGFKAAVAASTINLSLGFSHPIAVNLPDGVSAKMDKNILTISGHDKQLVGQVAADIRALKKPEPYKGKGIKYTEEHIRRKAGKTAAKG